MAVPKLTSKLRHALPDDTAWSHGPCELTRPATAEERLQALALRPRHMLPAHPAPAPCPCPGTLCPILQLFEACLQTGKPLNPKP